jgi:hypothetical protein
MPVNADALRERCVLIVIENHPFNLYIKRDIIIREALSPSHQVFMNQWFGDRTLQSSRSGLRLPLREKIFHRLA